MKTIEIIHSMMNEDENNQNLESFESFTNTGTCNCRTDSKDTEENSELELS